jgi:predicted DNA-binding transcriptional regulator AlpA
MRTRRQAPTPLPNAAREGWRPPGPLLVERTARADQLPLADTLAFSIPEFCRRHGISRAHFYNLSKAGDGPAVMRVGRRTLISAEAAAEWRRRMERIARDEVAGAFVDRS